ncbi:MAG: poly-gamma-glutamate hydrolase family protein, partial [Polyangiales bacterium]
EDRKRRYLEELLACRGVEEDLALRSRFGFMAFHGGSLETKTDAIAEEAAQKSEASFYAIRQPSNLRWHIPSSLFRADESAKLQAFFERVDVVVTVHGFRRKAFPGHVMLGGRNRALAAHLAETLRPKLPGAVVIDDLSKIPKPIRGVHPNNPVNVPRLSGVQVELSPLVRVDPSSLIAALAEAARTFAAG